MCAYADLRRETEHVCRAGAACRRAVFLLAPLIHFPDKAQHFVEATLLFISSSITMKLFVFSTLLALAAAFTTQPITGPAKLVDSPARSRTATVVYDGKANGRSLLRLHTYETARCRLFGVGWAKTTQAMQLPFPVIGIESSRTRGTNLCFKLSLMTETYRFSILHSAKTLDVSCTPFLFLLRRLCL